MELENVKLSSLVPYEWNPRMNYYAIEPVMESIRQCGYIAPIVVDENYVILAGHTRYEALKRLNIERVDVLVKAGLTDEQKKKFRILDNKTGELAEWDEDLLRGELEGLDLDGIHWFDDLFNPNVADISSGNSEKKESKKNDEPDDGIVRCPRCGTIVDDGEMPFGGNDDDEITWSADN